jgi:hypothetical protein
MLGAKPRTRLIANVSVEAEVTRDRRLSPFLTKYGQGDEFRTMLSNVSSSDVVISTRSADIRNQEPPHRNLGPSLGIEKGILWRLRVVNSVGFLANLQNPTQTGTPPYLALTDEYDAVRESA